LENCAYLFFNVYIKFEREETNSAMPHKNEKSRLSLVDKAYLEIRRRILEDRWQPGFQALEEAIALELEMSRTPVREALIRLEREGLVEILPRRGMRVVAISSTDMCEIYEVVTVLESEAAARLARMRPDAKFLHVLYNAVEAMDKALEKDDLKAWAKADEIFHTNLLKLCGNTRLAQMGMSVQDRIKRARLATLHERPVPHRSNDDHRALIDAIRSGDVEAARRIHTQHKQNAMNIVTEILKEKELNSVT
jgi:DNA-binding GntR family transcriptional regulator